jgi:site-specific recombinase XerD
VNDFLPFCQATFAAKPNTLSYYQNGVARLLEFPPLANESLDTISSDKIAAFARRQLDRGLKIASVNRELQVLRRMFVLAAEWAKVAKVLPRVRMVPGGARRDHVLTNDEERTYLEATEANGTAVLEAYRKALTGIRALERGEQPIPP